MIGLGGPPRAQRAEEIPVHEVLEAWLSLLDYRERAGAASPAASAPATVAGEAD